ncbi:MAG: hypothetical protein R3F48_03800 [Candidatus Zixiibacteriota bacterium]
MKKLVITCACLLIMGSMALADNVITGVTDFSISGMETNIAPPPVDAMNTLLEAGYITEADIAFIWRLYNNPGDELDECEISWWIFLKSLWRLIERAVMLYETIKAGQDLANWLDSLPGGSGIPSDYPVPRICGEPNQ